MKYVPALDGIRALAALSVVMGHSNVPGFGGGFIGVDVFFVLSGYLITQVLTEHPGLWRFYLRRFLRLAPPLALLLAVYLAVAPFVWPDYPHARDAMLAFFYLSDYSRALYTMPRYLAHTWSLSVEEHFYLLWPLIFLRFKPSVMVLALAYELLTLWRWAQGDFAFTYYRFDSHCTGLILGCLIAQLPRTKLEPAWPGLLVLGLACIFMPDGDRWPTMIIGQTLVEVAAAVAIFGRHPKWLGSKPMAYLGKLSYGIYLWNYPIARMLDGWSWQHSILVALPASIALSALSYHTVEAMVRASRTRYVPAAPVAHSPG